MPAQCGTALAYWTALIALLFAPSACVGGVQLRTLASGCKKDSQVWQPVLTRSLAGGLLFGIVADVTAAFVWLISHGKDVAVSCDNGGFLAEGLESRAVERLGGRSCLKSESRPGWRRGHLGVRHSDKLRF